MVDVGTVVAGGAGVAVAILAVLTLIQLAGVWPSRAATWKVAAVVVSAVAMLGVGILVTYRAASGEPLTIGVLAVAAVAAAVTAVLADDVSGDGG
ncbi:MAG: hypothetical protein ABEJ57_01475 [Halobacteriaceae archaeon]